MKSADLANAGVALSPSSQRPPDAALLGPLHVTGCESLPARASWHRPRIPSPSLTLRRRSPSASEPSHRSREASESGRSWQHRAQAPAIGRSHRPAPGSRAPLLSARPSASTVPADDTRLACSHHPADLQEPRVSAEHQGSGRPRKCVNRGRECQQDENPRSGGGFVVSGTACYSHSPMNSR